MDQTDGKWTNGQTNKATGKRTDGQTNGPTDRWNDGPMHYRPEASKNDAFGGRNHSLTRSTPLHYTPFRFAPLRSVPLRAAPLAGSFASEKVAIY